MARAGDYLYVDPDVTAVDGRVVLFGHGADAVVRLLAVEAGGRRVLRNLREGYPEIVVDAGNETDIRGAVVFGGRKVSREPPAPSLAVLRRLKGAGAVVTGRRNERSQTRPISDPQRTSGVVVRSSQYYTMTATP